MKNAMVFLKICSKIFFPAGNQILFNDNSQLRSYQLPISVHDNDNGNDGGTVPSVPPAPRSVAILFRPLKIAEVFSSESAFFGKPTINYYEWWH